MQKVFTKKKYFSKVFKRGFTLIELLVVIVIMSLVTLVFLNKQGKFDSSTIMRSIAYSIALSVRQAQVYGVSVRSSTSVAGQFTSAHGLYFLTSTPTSYILFADQNRNNKYDTAPTDGLDKAFSLNGGYTITELCAVTSGGVRNCTGADDTGGIPISAISFIFVRPNPDAKIYAFDSTGTVLSATYSSGYVQVSSQNGDKRFIAITNTGQVSVCALGATLGSTGC